MKRLPTSMWLSPHTKAILDSASAKLGIPKTACYEMALRDFAEKHKVSVEVLSESVGCQRADVQTASGPATKSARGITGHQSAHAF